MERSRQKMPCGNDFDMSDGWRSRRCPRCRGRSRLPGLERKAYDLAEAKLLKSAIVCKYRVRSQYFKTSHGAQTGAPPPAFLGADIAAGVDAQVAAAEALFFCLLFSAWRKNMTSNGCAATMSAMEVIDVTN